MLFFVIELDDEQIIKDGIINLNAAYQTIEDTFAQSVGLSNICYTDAR